MDAVLLRDDYEELEIALNPGSLQSTLLEAPSDSVGQAFVEDFDMSPARTFQLSIPGAYSSEFQPPLHIEMAFSYESLPPGPWIRVLCLKPGRGYDPIECSLHPALLIDVAGCYDALSYVWGPESPSYSIQVDGCALTVRENLLHFLLSLRSLTEPFDLWADAICIDQNSTEEKNHQVQQMKTIYRCSRTTRLWLGKSDPNVDMLFQPRKSGMFLAQSIASKLSNGLITILSNPYWTRLWIVQEVILSPAVQVHHWQHQSSWIDFVRLCKEAAALVMEAALYSERELWEPPNYSLGVRYLIYIIEGWIEIKQAFPQLLRITRKVTVPTFATAYSDCLAWWTTSRFESIMDCPESSFSKRF